MFYIKYIYIMIDNKKNNFLENINGFEVYDNYRWLEDYSNQEVKDWIDKQNIQTEEKLINDNYNVFYKELEKGLDYDAYTNFSKKEDKYFFRKRLSGEDQWSVYMRDNLNGEDLEIITTKNNRESIDYFSPSKTGKYVIYGISKSGDEIADLFVKDLDKNEIIQEIKNCRYSSIAWMDNESGFFYTRNPKKGTVPDDELSMHAKIYFHNIGEDSNKDKLIFGEGRPKDDMLKIKISPDNKYLSIRVANDFSKNDIHIYDINNESTKHLIKGYNSSFSLVFLKDKILLQTNHNANNNKILQNSYKKMFDGLDSWKEFVSEKDNILNSFNVTKNKIILNYTENIISKSEIIDHEGNFLKELPLPDNSTIGKISSSLKEEEFFYNYQSFIIPKMMIRFNPEENKFEEFIKTKNTINSENYIVKQKWTTSKDGVKIPMFIFHSKDIELDGKNPTIITGYGGFGLSREPAFISSYIPFIKRGGVFVVSNIRGGGEFGKSWHDAATKENKQNSYDDFIACSEYLIENKYTNSKKLGCMGGSNGGLLVSVVGVQRHDLFIAICSHVPLTDMVRFHNFGMASRWIHEYGNPEDKEELKNILKWSPYHNVEKDIKYPTFLFTTGEKDNRVDPLHARKMCAIIQDTKDNKSLIFTEKESGHGAGKPIKKVLEMQARVLSFFKTNLDLKM